MRHKLIWFLLVAVIVTALDLFTKVRAFAFLPGEGQQYEVIEGTFWLAHHRNTGGMWGIGQDWNPWILRSVRILAVDSTPVRLTLGGETVQLTAIDQDLGNAAEEVDATYEGEPMTIAFNPDYLASGIDAVDSDDVTLSTMDPMKPAVLRGVGRDDYLYLLMPVRVP